MASVDGFLDICGDAGVGSFQQLQSEVDATWVEEALEHTGKLTIRRRVMPNEVVVWLVIGIALFRDLAIDAVVKHLRVPVGGTPGRKSPTGSPVGSDTVSKARQRVGAAPLERLFATSAGRWFDEFAEQHLWKGLKLLSIDGSTLRIPDTIENETVYGRPGSSRSTAGYPHARILGLLSVGCRVLVDFVVGTYRQSEQELVELLWEKLPPNSLVILDRGFVNFAAFARIPMMNSGGHWLCRAKAKLNYKLIQVLGPGDSLVELKVSSKHRKRWPNLPETIVVRRLEYQLTGPTIYSLFTSLKDPVAFPSEDVVRLYHQRWEVEIAYAEVKTQMLDRRESIRSKTAEGVLQEIMGVAIAYNLVRVMMARAAKKAEVPPFRMSFRNSFLHIRSFLLAAAQVAPSAIPKLYTNLCEDLTLLLLPERRDRQYRREVKIKMSNYPRKAVRGGT